MQLFQEASFIFKSVAPSRLHCSVFYRGWRVKDAMCVWALDRSAAWAASTLFRFLSGRCLFVILQAYLSITFFLVFSTDCSAAVLGHVVTTRRIVCASTCLLAALSGLKVQRPFKLWLRSNARRSHTVCSHDSEHRSRLCSWTFICICCPLRWPLAVS